MLAAEIEQRVVRDLWLLEIGEGFEHDKVRRFLAEVGAKAHFTCLVAMKAVATDKERYLAGSRGAVGDHPGGSAADFAVVNADIGLARASGKIRQQRKDGDTLFGQCCDSRGHRRMFGRDDCNRMAALREFMHLCGDFIGFSWACPLQAENTAKVSGLGDR